MEKSEKQEKQRRLIIIALIIGMAVCIGVTIWALFFRNTQEQVLIPDYAPQAAEQNAEPLSDNGEKLDVPSGGGGISLEYDSNVNISLADKTAYLNYTHPGRSTQDIVLCIEINGEIVAQSGTIEPGNRLKKLALLDGAEKKLSEGTYTDADFRVLSYDPESGEKAMVDTVAKITVTVEK